LATPPPDVVAPAAGATSAIGLYCLAYRLYADGDDTLPALACLHRLIDLSWHTRQEVRRIEAAQWYCQLGRPGCALATALYHGRMTTTAATLYKGDRFPAEIIAHAVWLYFRFPLSYRQVKEILAARGIIVSYETIREWCRKCGQTYATALHRRRAQPGGKMAPG
jgi:hypothetical protein